MTLILRFPVAVVWHCFDVSTTIEMMSRIVIGFRMAVENLRAGILAIWAGGRAEGLQVRGNRFKNTWFDREERELSFAADIDQAAGLELLDVMRERGRRDREGLVGVAATQWATGPRNSLQEFKSLWIGQRLQNRGALGAR